MPWFKRILLFLAIWIGLVALSTVLTDTPLDGSLKPWFAFTDSEYGDPFWLYTSKHIWFYGGGNRNLTRVGLGGTVSVNLPLLATVLLMLAPLAMLLYAAIGRVRAAWRYRRIRRMMPADGFAGLPVEPPSLPGWARLLGLAAVLALLFAFTRRIWIEYHYGMGTWSVNGWFWDVLPLVGLGVGCIAGLAVPVRRWQRWSLGLIGGILAYLPSLLMEPIFYQHPDGTWQPFPDPPLVVRAGMWGLVVLVTARVGAAWILRARRNVRRQREAAAVASVVELDGTADHPWSAQAQGGLATGESSNSIPQRRMLLWRCLAALPLLMGIAIEVVKQNGFDITLWHGGDYVPTPFLAIVAQVALLAGIFSPLPWARLVGAAGSLLTLGYLVPVWGWAVSNMLTTMTWDLSWIVAKYNLRALFCVALMPCTWHLLKLEAAEVISVPSARRPRFPVQDEIEVPGHWDAGKRS